LIAGHRLDVSSWVVNTLLLLVVEGSEIRTQPILKISRKFRY
jgi:hypothetical protein